MHKWTVPQIVRLVRCSPHRLTSTEKRTKRVSLLTCKICKQKNTPRGKVSHLEVDRFKSTEIMNEISDTQPDPHAVLFCRRHLCFLTLQSHRCTWCQNNTAHSNAPWHTTALTGSSAASSPSGALSLLLAEQHNEATAKNIKALVIGHVLLPKKLKLKTS